MADTSDKPSSTTSTTTTTPLPQLIVGGGVVGINTATVFAEQGVPFVVFEQSGVIGGCWNRDNSWCGSPNATSTVQSDPVAYTRAGWFSEETEDCRHHQLEDDEALDKNDPCRGLHMTVESVVKNTTQIQQAHKIPVQFHRQVIAFDYKDDSRVSVTWKDLQTQQEHVQDFGGVHFRTGRLNKVSKVTLPGENDTFQGPVIHGCFGKIDEIKDLQGKTLVVVGWGPFAVENARIALQRGAKKVHMVSRNHKAHFFDYSIYQARKFYYPESDPNWGAQVWEAVIDGNKTAARACGVEDVLCAPDIYPMIEGKQHLKMYKGGCISVTIDAVALGMHYGLIEYHQGSVETLLANSVLTTNGEEIAADIVVKCTGFDQVLGPVAGHYAHDTIFVDGKSNITSYHAIDGQEEDAFFGPCIPGTSSYLVSPHPLMDFDRAITYFMEHPTKFAEFKALPTFTRIQSVEYAAMVSIMFLFNKLFAFGDETIIENFIKSMTKKRADYEAVLDEQTFLKKDQKRWMAWSTFFAAKTGKPVLEYPFADRILLVAKKEADKNDNVEEKKEN